MLSSAFLPDSLHLLADQSIDVPLLQVLGPESPVEIDGWLIPVEHRPFHAATAAAVRLFHQGGEEGITDLPLPEFGKNEEVLEIERGRARKLEYVSNTKA